jgi:hypothetical protein
LLEQRKREAIYRFLKADKNKGSAEAFNDRVRVDTKTKQLPISFLTFSALEDWF